MAAVFSGQQVEAVTATPKYLEEEDDNLPDSDLPGDHAWHYRYNRRLSFFSHAVARLTFSQDGQWLVSATNSGTVKIFDTGIWAEAARLMGCPHEEPRVIAISPAQTWLVCVFPSVMHIFQCKPPWRLEQKVSAPLDPATKAPSEWCCVAFSPLCEVDHPGGFAGQDNHLAAFASKALCVMDYSGGWKDTPKRTRRSFDDARPTSITYTACGTWLVCGYENGHVQIWNHFSLTLDRTLGGHNGGLVACITASPRAAKYDSRFISCGGDSALRVWHSNGWLLEQIAPDTKADRHGIHSCMFSSGGDWVVSVALELCVWRVCISRKGKLELRLHQRLAAVCGAEGLCSAAICSHRDEIAVGSRDGVLGLWAKMTGPPKQLLHADESHSIQECKREAAVTPWVGSTPVKGMMNVRPEGSVDNVARSFRSSDWSMRANLRSLLDAAPVLLPSGRELPPGGRARGSNHERLTRCSAVTASASKLPAPVRMSPIASSVRTKLPAANVQKVAAFGSDTGKEDKSMQKSASVPLLPRWKSTPFEFEGNATNQRGNETSSASSPMKKALMPNIRATSSKPPGDAFSHISGNTSYLDGELPPLVGNELSPVRAAMLHAKRGLVQRISLDPQKIG